MPLGYYEVVEAGHRILNPLSAAKLALVGELCGLAAGHRVLDLACGKAELLATWAHQHAITGVGVDTSAVFLAAARDRLCELDIDGQIELVEGDAGSYRPDPVFDVTACIGATWIGTGLAGTLKLLRSGLAGDGRIVVGEPFWYEQPPLAAYEALRTDPHQYATLPETVRRFAAEGLDVVDMVLADTDSRDRYEARHWAAADQWRRGNPGDLAASQIYDQAQWWQRAYLQYGRRYQGWGVFIARPAI